MTPTSRAREDFLFIDSLRKDFGGVRAVDRFSLRLLEGEMLCVIGPNGCGKTTLFNLVTGALHPTSGRIYFCDQDITGLPPQVISRLGIGRKFQVPGIYPEHTVIENVEIAMFGNRGVNGLSGLFRRSPTSTEVRSIVAQVGLENKTGVNAGTLSHGEKQWLEIGMVLASRPKLMLLDEPTAGMTASETEATVRLIQRISSETGASLIIIEHDIAFIRQLACPIIVMLKGSPACRGSYDEIRSNTLVRQAYLGKNA